MAHAFQRSTSRALGLMAVVGVLHVAPASAQEGGSWATEEHECGDCHGTHAPGRGRSALVRSGVSEVSPQAPGVGEATVRCLQCHGTEADRRLVRADRKVPLLGAALLGGNLTDDHVLGAFTPSGATAGFDPLRTGLGALPILRADLPPSGVVECTSCHDAHETWLVTQPSQLQDDVCLKCHDPGLDTGSHGVASCGNCHGMHGSPSPTGLVREAQADHLCGACHEGAPRPTALGIEPIPAQPVHTEPANPRCSECHTIH